MITKEQLESILADQEKVKAELEAIKTKSKTLEEENLRLTQVSTQQRSNSDEARAMAYFGVSNAKDLLHVNVGAPHFAEVPTNLKYLVLELKKSVDVARMTAQMFGHGPLDDRKDDASPVAVKSILDTYYGKNVLAPRLKAFGTGVSGGGAEWIPTIVSSTYIEEYALLRALEEKFKTVPMPSNPYDLPTVESGTKARKATEGTIMTGTNPTTGKVTLNAVKLSEYYICPEELSEDSAPDILSMGRDEVVKAQKNAMESGMINGDNSGVGVHIDSDYAAAAEDICEKQFSGFRHEAINNSANGATLDFGNAIVDDTKCGVLASRLGKFAVNPAECVWVVGPVVWAQMRKMTSVFTQDKWGPNASVHSGVLAYYMGSPVVTSEYMREVLNASGVYDGVTTTRAGILFLNTTRFLIGNRRPIQVKLMADLPYHDRWLIASYRRVAFKARTQGASEVSVAYGYNVAK